MKKFLCSSLAVMLLLSTCIFPASAEPLDIVPLQETACGYGNGIHDMESCGWGTVHNGHTSDTIFSGPAWQCRNGRCYTVIITEYEVLLENYIGRYATEIYDGECAQGVFMFKDPSQVGFWGKWPMDGFSFRYA